MQSVIKPLNDKVTILTNNLGTVLRGLRRGDPETTKQVSSLISSIKSTKADFKSTVNSMYASYEASIATMAGLYNPMPMVKIIAFFLQEAIAAIQLLTNLLKLIANLLSISSLLALISDDILAMQQWLNKKVLWLTRALERVKQKTKKWIEWKQREISANLTLIYLKSNKVTVENTLKLLKDKLANTQQVDLGTPNPDVNGNYQSGVFVYYKASEVKEQEVIINAVQGNLNEIETEIKEKELELSKYIPNDKKFYEKLWSDAEEKDKKDLLQDTPKLDADVVL